MATSKGYEYEFIDPVFDDLYCKKCTLVARRLTVATCCAESFCHACIEDTREQGKPCPECGKTDFTTFEHVKNQRRINCLRVHCSMKERGCDWSGTLEQLDTHLDPDQDNCQYVDTKCPLNCHMTIPKNKVEQHVAQHCAKRPYVCQHCNFKATYEVVVDKHLPECKYVPLQCPNLCGVTFERDFMEDHMKMCRLEKVGCEFSGVGCDDRFRREDQEEHTRQNSQKHLTLTASLAVETKEQLQQKLLEQDKKHKEEEEKLRQKIEEQEKKIEELAKKDNEHNEEEHRLVEQQKSLQAQLSELSIRSGMALTFIMMGFTKAKNESSTWKSPAMLTAQQGRKFFLEIRANGYGAGHGKAVHVALWSTPGDFDSWFKWPVKVKIRIELAGRENKVALKDVKWHMPAGSFYVTEFGKKNYSGCYHFIDHSELDNYLANDKLLFCVTPTLPQ